MISKICLSQLLDSLTNVRPKSVTFIKHVKCDDLTYYTKMESFFFSVDKFFPEIK